jgi:PAS domain S-box-containing protein
MKPGDIWAELERAAGNSLGDKRRLLGRRSSPPPYSPNRKTEPDEPAGEGAPMSDGAGTVRDEGELFFKELADNAPVMIWRSAPDALCDWFNKPWLDFVGRAMEQEIGNGWAQGVHPDDFDRCLEVYLSAFEARESFTMTYRLRRADGLYREILDNGKPFYRAGAFAGYFGSCIDVTEQTAAEAQLRQAKKMEAIGHLTGGVAHDFNNLLQVIGGNLDLLKKDLPDDARAQRRLRTAMEAVSLGAKLSSQLLSYARRQALRPKVVNVGQLVREMEQMLRGAVGDAVQIETHIDRDLWNTLVDPVQLETVLLNLAFNARDAMMGRGMLGVDLRNAALNGAAARRVGLSAGNYVALDVSDTGCGMSPDTVERVFDPFFTTKGEGFGTGLGLSMAQGFVRQSGGHIGIESEPGRGTTIRIYLPRSTQTETGSTEVDVGPMTGGTETILLVEDSDLVRATTADALAGLGYTVVEAQDGDSALALIESGVQAGALLTDVVMPGSVRSAELARKARERLPAIAVLFTSGYAHDRLHDEGALEEGAELLGKPFTLEELDRALRRMLAVRAARV